MNIHELRKAPHLSASGINAYIECGLLYRLSRIEKLEPEFSADTLELGSVIHETMAHFNRERMVGGHLSLDELLSIFDSYWRDAAQDNENIEYGEDKDFETLLDQGKGLLRAYYENLPQDGFTVLAIEEPFRFTIADVPVIGVFDFIEEDPSGAVIVVDIKTTARAYSESDIERNFQMTLYQMAAKACGFSGREILLRFDCLIKTKNPRFEQYYTKRSEADEKRAKRKIMEVWRAIKTGIFIPNDSSWRCSGCGYKQYCNDWFLKEE